MTPEEKQAHKKKLQHEAYRRWYTGPKGKAYLENKKKKPLAERPAAICPNCKDPTCVTSGCIGA